MSLLKKILNIPDRYIYIALLIALVFPLLRPLGLPISVSDTTRTYFEGIDALEPGTIVFVAHDAHPATEMELGLSSHAVLNHLFKKEGLRIVTVSLSTGGPMFWEKTLEEVGALDKYRNGYGDDYVYLGYLAGGETAIAALTVGIDKATGGVDFYGTDLSDLKLMQEVNEASDFDILINVDAPGDWPLMWMRQWAVPFETPYYVNPLGGVAASLWPFIEAGQIQAMLVGAKGAAEYELLSKSPGRAIAGMDAQSVGQLYLLGLVIVTNIAYVLTGGEV